MTRIMQPDAVAVIGASSGEGKIGNSVMKNLIDGGYAGEIYPIHPKETEILGRQCYASVTDVPGNIDIAIFCIPAAFVANTLKECGAKNIPGAVLIPSGFAEIGEHELQAEIVQVAHEENVRLMGPNIYGFYYTHKNLCATFCTPYDERAKSRCRHNRAASGWRSSASAARRRWAFPRSSGSATRPISTKTIC